MQIGFVGLGKLGLPVATCISMHGYTVQGYDIDATRMSKEPQKYMEAGPFGNGEFNTFLAKAKNLSFGTLAEVCNNHIVFVAVQTPHQPQYEGIIPMPEERLDFDYSYLIKAVTDMVPYLKRGTILSIISTCLPGTMRREIIPLLPEGVALVYNPFFIAMGTVMQDFRHPEFILMGTDNVKAAQELTLFYKRITAAKVQIMSIESAELTKVAYNTFISMKLGFVNTLLEICTKIPGADIDEVTNALKKATTRLISPAYLTAGMGDGGACHPRDNIAMSSLARRLELSFDFFEAVMHSREAQAKWFAKELLAFQVKYSLPIVIFGYAFKPNTDITTGSHALLVSHYLRVAYRMEDVIMYDPIIDPALELDFPAIYFIGCTHDIIVEGKFTFPIGSIVIDPHRIIKNQKDIFVLRLGEGWEIKNG